MILPSLYILSYILSMATYVLDGKTARIFAEVKSARARAVKRKVWSERVKTGSETGPFQSTYAVVLQKVKRRNLHRNCV